MRIGLSSHLGWKTPTTAANFTPGQATAAFSISIELTHSPPDLMTSFLRSVMRMKPYSSIVAISPVSNQPSARSEEHTSELQSLMRISYAVFCLTKQTKQPHEQIKDNARSSNKTT